MTSTIPITCACGARLRAPQEAAGKRLKCPKCGASVAVPRTQARPAQPVAVPAPTPVLVAARTKLEGLSPDYRIRLGRWMEVARPHFRAILGPSIGYFGLFLPVFAVCAWLIMAPVALMFDPSTNSFERLVGLALLPVGLAANTLVLPALTVGLHIVCQAQLKSKPWNFGTFFAGFRKIWPLASCAAIIQLIYGAPLLLTPADTLVGKLFWDQTPPALVGITTALASAGALAAAYVVLRLVFFPHYLIIDRGCGAIEALRGSWLLSRGHFWSLLGTLLLLTVTATLFSLITCGLGIVVAAPFAVLVLNAGYLLVAGSEPLPRQERDCERVASAPRRMPAWLPAAAAAAVLLVVGTAMGWLAYSDRAQHDTAMARRKQESEKTRARYEEEARLRQIREREETEQNARELQTFFREGGLWSMQIIDRDDRPAETPKGDLKGPVGGAGGFEERPVLVLVLGPRGLLKNKPAVRFGKPSAPQPVGESMRHRLEDLAIATRESRRQERWQVFFHQYADALAGGDVEAVLVEVKRPPVDGGGPGGVGAAPGGAGRLGDLGAPPGAGGEAVRDPLHGIPVPLDKAVPLTRERFLKLVDDRTDGPGK